jgi:hypothetical protein
LGIGNSSFLTLAAICFVLALQYNQTYDKRCHGRAIQLEKTNRQGQITEPQVQKNERYFFLYLITKGL